MAWLAMGLSAETALFVLAGFAWLLSRDYTLAEAGAGAVVAVFMALSLIYQVCLFIGSPLPGLILEATALAVVIGTGRRWLPLLVRTAVSATRLVRQDTLPGLTIAAAWTLMAGLVVASWMSTPPLAVDTSWHGLLSGSMVGGLPSLGGTEPLPPLNAAALFYHTARFGLDPNACGFGLLAYMAVGFSTYTLARRYAWPPMALTVTLMVLSMPRLVFLERWPSDEWISTAAVVYSIVLLFRLVELHRGGDLGFFVFCILFSLYANPISMALTPVLALLLMVVMIRRHGWLLSRQLLTGKPLMTALVLLPALVLSQIPVFSFNLAHGHPLFGVPIYLENDGIRGGAANLIRYLLVSFDPTEPVRQMLAVSLGLDLNRLIMGIHSTLVTPLFGQAGMHGPFVPIASGSRSAGFGPLAPLLVLPAMTHALVRGPRRLKAVSLAWAGYLYLAALVVAWEPDNLSVLTSLFAANGFVVAFSLPPWRLRRRGMRILQVLFAVLLAWSLVCYAWRPL